MTAAKKLELTQGTPEWIEKRYDYLTSSNTPVLFDLSPYQTPLGLFEELVMRTPAPIEGKEILFQRGHNAEKRAREYMKEKGFEYEPAVMVNEKFPDLLASLDGITSDGKRIFECKFVGKDALAEIRKGEIPPHHLCQVQAALAVSDAEVCDYFATDTTGDSHWVEIHPNSDYQSEIAIAAHKFMEGVRNGVAPDAGEKDFFIPENDARFEELELLKADLDRVEYLYNELKSEIVETYKDKRRVRCGPVTIVKSIRRGNIDYKKVPVLKGLDLDKYRAPSTEVVTVKVGKK